MSTCLMADLATSSVEPTYFTQASKDPKWRQAMDIEINALLKNKKLVSCVVPPYHESGWLQMSFQGKT